jgi:putative ABC transport system ATP-binding protein
MNTPVLTVRGLCKDHGEGATRVRALAGLDLDLSAGEFVAVTGASGSGKSTLLHLLAGLARPTSGSIRLDGAEMTVLDEDGLARLRRSRIGLVFQSYQLMPTLDAEENVALPLAIAGRPRAEARSRAAAFLDRVGLGARRGHRPHQLSGGEQQRVAIARALVAGPAVVLADEPAGNLDSARGAEVMALLRECAAERRQALLMVTHDAGHAALADRVLRLHDGRLTPPACAA